MQHLWRDLRHTLRGLAIVPALSATIVATVGIGLGATVATLVLVKTVLVLLAGTVPFMSFVAERKVMHDLRAGTPATVTA